MYQVILFYKYIPIEDPEKLMHEQRTLCLRLGLRGRTIIAKEGINATLEGTAKNIGKYIEELKKDSRFADVHWKKSHGTGNAFPKLSIKVRDEIVSLHLGNRDINPTEVTGKYLTPEELHSWIHPPTGFHSDESSQRAGQAKEFYIIDMRNDYETKSGYFENSIFPGLTNFRNLRDSLPKLHHLKNKTIVTVCTGGVRCEKASGFLKVQGFADVYQLQGGIVSYMEKYPNQDFVGKLYVFDNRITMGFNVDSSEHKIVGKCEGCGISADTYVNCINNFCHRHFIECADCRQNYKGLCPRGCREYRTRRTNSLS